MSFKRTVEDLTNKVFGKRKVLRRIEAPLHIKNKNQTYWEVECECGDIGWSTGGQLRFGSRGSCKICKMKEKRKEFGESSFNGLYLRYKHGAEGRELSFNLTKDEFRALAKNNCHYCNQTPTNVIKLKTGYGQFIYNGIDRIDSDIGYNITNCITCCEVCNRAKSDMTYDNFIKWMKQLTNFRGASEK